MATLKEIADYVKSLDDVVLSVQSREELVATNQQLSHYCHELLERLNKTSLNRARYHPAYLPQDRQ